MDLYLNASTSKTEVTAQGFLQVESGILEMPIHWFPGAGAGNFPIGVYQCFRTAVATASAIANRNESIQGRPNAAFTSRTNSTSEGTGFLMLQAETFIARP